MASVTLTGTPVQLAGNELTAGAQAPDFTLQTSDLGDVTLATIPIDLGTGANLVGRVGLAIGLG